jgi:hypothetical protein
MINGDGITYLTKTEKVKMFDSLTKTEKVKMFDSLTKTEKVNMFDSDKDKKS